MKNSEVIIIRVRKRPFISFLFLIISRKMKIDFGQFSIQFLIFQITEKIEIGNFGNFQFRF